MVVLTDGERAFEASARQELSPLAKARVEPAPTEGLRDIARRGAREAERRALAELLERVNWNRRDLRVRARPSGPPHTVKFSSHRIPNYTVVESYAFRF